MKYQVSLGTMPSQSSIIVVGCGGTGGFVAEGLCRLLKGTSTKLLLVDYDRVEPHNLLRQNFFAEDLGKFKSQALAERLARQYGRTIGYSIHPYDKELHGEDFGGIGYTHAIQGLIIGCVDNSAARRDIANGLQWGSWWLDAGNGFSSGQVLLGNARNLSEITGSFDNDSGTVGHLPIPSWQLPGLLAPPTVTKKAARDCAQEIDDMTQSPVINQAMATLVIQFVYKLLNGTLSWMGAYLDLDAGTLYAAPADPVTVAKLCGVKVDTLMSPGCSLGNRYRVS